MAAPGARRRITTLRRVGYVLAALYAVYLALANALLNSSWGEDLANRQPEKFRGSWSSAWSLYPGHVRVNDLRIAGHVRRTVWSVQASSAAGRIALLPLLHKELRVPLVTARGVSGGASRVDHVRQPPEPRPGGWTLNFPRIVADPAEYAYFDGLVLAGSGRGEGGFLKVLRGGPMEMPRSTLHFEQARLYQQGIVLASELGVDGGFSIARHRSAEAPGIRKLAKMDIDLELDGVASGVRVELSPELRPVVSPGEGRGRLAGRLGWRQGSLLPGSTLGIEVPVDYFLEGDRRSTIATGGVEVGDDEVDLRAALAPPAGVSFDAQAELLIRGREIPIPEIAQLVHRASGHLLANWHFESLAWLSALVPGQGIVAFDGAGTVQADLRFADGQLRPGSFLDVPRVEAVVNALGNRFDGEAHARVTFDEGAPGTLSPRLEAVMREFRVAAEEATDRPFVEGRDLRVNARAAGRIDELRERFTANVAFKDAKVPDLRVYNHYLPTARIMIAGGSGLLSGDLHFDGSRQVGHGTLHVRGGNARLQLAALDLAGDVELTTRLKRADLREQRFDVDGSRLVLRKVTVNGVDGELGRDWWADVDITRGHLDWGKPVRVDGTTRLRMKDLEVLLALYAQKKELPRWIQRLIDEGEVNAQGRLNWAGDGLVLDGVTASNDRFDVAARMKLEDKALSGDLYARWGILSLGVDVEHGRKDVHLVRARHWYDSQPSLLPR